MKFIFKGKDTTTYKFYKDKIYNILQFGIKNNHFIIYAINEENKMVLVPYLSIDVFNDNWNFMEE